MSKINRRKEATGSSNEGTSARTRPLSFDEIMLRRNKKLNAETLKESSNSLKDHQVQDNIKLTSGHLDADRNDKGMKDIKDAKGNSRKSKEQPPKVKDVGFETKGKHKIDSDSNKKLRLIYSKSSKDKDIMNEKQKYRGSKDGDRLRTSSTKELERKQPKLSIEKNKHEERDKKSRGGMKRKEHGYADEKYRSELDFGSSRRYHSGKMQHTEQTERNDRRKDGSKLYFEELKSKRRLSRSPEHMRQRGRSISSSPRSHKHPYHEREHEGPSFVSFKDKPRRKHSDGDKQRTSGNGAYSAQYRKHGSGLGGYSPRKRRPEATVRSPSPTIPSPERKTAKWDQPPAEARNSGFWVMPSNVQSSVNKVPEPASTAPVTLATQITQQTPAAEIPSKLMSASIDSVQLTQATRPLRRLYVENLPALASERIVVDFINNLLVTSGVNLIKGSAPCISCILNKEKNQGVVEFLTPEDATSALSFDGRSFSGSLLKIKRPKDFVEATTAVSEKPKEDVRLVADIVKDSPHKIFIGGISEAISADMLMEVVGAFGNLKSYHFEFNKELNGPCAFLEYVDHSITSKACAGLNGMKLGGCVLTVVQALPDAQVDQEEKAEMAPCYDIPVTANLLLTPVTKVLQLKNVFNREEFLLLSESELAEIIEDIRLECTRFGTVKSVNIVRDSSNPGTTAKAFETYPNGCSMKVESIMEFSSNDDSKQDRDILPQDDIKSTLDISNGIEGVQDNNEIPFEEFRESEKDDATQVDDATIGKPMESEKGVSVKAEVGTEVSLRCETPNLDVVDDEMGRNACLSEAVVEKLGLTTANAQLIENTDIPVSSSNPKEVDTSKESLEHMSADITNVISTARENVETAIQNEDQKNSKQDMLELGTVFVEFLRKEATCIAAHCLHGRTYGERVVTAGFFPHDLYLAHFGR